MNNYRPPQFGLFPPVVKNLLIINTLVFLTEIIVRNTYQYDITTLFGLHYFEASNFKIYQLVTYLFLHDPSNIWHLLSNMFALWMFGNILENFWGAKRFIAFYLICGIGAGITQEITQYVYFHHIKNTIELFNAFPTADNFDSLVASYFQNLSGYPIPLTPADRMLTLNKLYQFALTEPNTIGASGAIFGVLLAFGMLFPNTLLYLYFAIPIKAKYFVIMYGLLELFLGVKSAAGDNVAHYAHLGGMVFGFFLIMYWKKKRTL